MWHNSRPARGFFRRRALPELRVMTLPVNLDQILDLQRRRDDAYSEMLHQGRISSGLISSAGAVNYASSIGGYRLHVSDAEELYQRLCAETLAAQISYAEAVRHDIDPKTTGVADHA
jgi:hypothetical protein